MRLQTSGNCKRAPVAADPRHAVSNPAGASRCCNCRCQCHRAAHAACNRSTQQRARWRPRAGAAADCATEVVSRVTAPLAPLTAVSFYIHSNRARTARCAQTRWRQALGLEPRKCRRAVHRCSQVSSVTLRSARLARVRVKTRPSQLTASRPCNLWRAAYLARNQYKFTTDSVHVQLIWLNFYLVVQNKMWPLSAAYGKVSLP